ncbi:LysM peptidoglycan-binding domain-containing protein [Actinomadura sp. GC306]|uniref:BTAD domain-containing putative transcriptional regulator n=1 Tax=Actinomadura sp. GC306 TaxID=2530367 RepID=UPI0010509A05|nr:BTAD domain-containing putative transcriptional regulator [Actinomadura sp. GC306]TDC69841.1 LysM peptidoglycan-binding domain-containing protein [Actinomadura sp. GC306]
MTYTNTERGHLADFIRGLAAFVVFAFLLVGCPVAMYAMGGSPIPDRFPSWEEVGATLMRRDTDQSVFLATIWLLGWGSWCLFVVTVCAEVINYFAELNRPVLPRPARPLQHLVGELVATAALTFSAAASLATSASAATHTHTVTDVHAGAAPSVEEDHQSPRRVAPPQGPAASEWTPLLADEAPSHPKPDTRPERTHVVKRGETLWDLARRTYGSGGLYPKIFKSSRNIDQPDGVPALTNPSSIHPGQHLRIPRPSAPDGSSSPSRVDSTPPAPEQSTPPGRGRANENRSSASAGSTSGESRPTQVPSPVVAPPRDGSASPAPSAPNDQDSAGAPLAISLPSGSLIGIGLAAALSVAVAATRLHRRRRRVPNPDPSSYGRATDSPLPAPVLKARHAHMRTYNDRDAPTPSDPDLVREDLHAAEPDQLVVGTRNDQALTVRLAGLSLGLSGDGAHAAARAITTELLAKAHRYRAEVLIPQADAQALFPGDDITDLCAALEGLIITPSLDEATNRLEAELLRRGRILEMAEQPDVPALRGEDPAEPLPTVLLVASVPADNGTVQGLAALGRRYSLGVLALGPWPSGTRVGLSSDTTVTAAHGPDAERFIGARLFHLTTDDAAGMLRTIRTATGTETDAASLSPDAGVEPEPGPEAEPPAVSTMIPPPRTSEEARHAPVRLDVLGPVRLFTANGPVNTGLRQRARDLLAYLAVHPDGATRDQACADLWPEDNPESVVPMFNTAVTNIRSVLRTATGLSEPMYVIHDAGRYRIDPDVIDIDLWRLTTALAEARRAADDTARIKALTLVADRCGDEFGGGLTQEWAEVQRENLRRTTGDALANLARLIEEDDPEQALVVLERAITHDRYSEPLHRHIMRLQARLDRPDAVRRTYELLAARLGELDVEPDDETRKLLSSSTRASNRNR